MIENQEKHESSEEINHQNKLENIIKDGKLQVEIATTGTQTEGIAKTNYSNLQNTHLNNSIRFADTKAAALVAVNGLIAKFVFDLVAKQNQTLQIELTLGFIFLIIGIALSVLVVFPQKENSKAKGVVYWENIIQMDPDEYIDTIEGMDPMELRKHILKNNYILSKIITKKFDYLRYAFISSLIGYGILAFVAIIIFFINIK